MNIKAHGPWGFEDFYVSQCKSVEAICFHGDQWVLIRPDQNTTKPFRHPIDALDNK